MMKRWWPQTFGWGLLLFSHWTFGQEIAELKFNSSSESFQLKKVAGHFELAGKPVKLGTFEQFLPLFTSEIEGSCEQKGKADLTVKGLAKGKWIERKFFVKAKQVGDGTNCSNVNGDGIYFVPFSKSWFDESATGSIALGDSLQLTRDKSVIVTVEKSKGEWRSGDPKLFLNWDFFANFTDSIKEFPITHHLHPAAVEGKPGFQLTTSGKRYQFYKLGNSLWVMARPGSKWLVGSSAWSNWVDMEPSQWEDHNNSQLNFIVDKANGVAERKGTLLSLEGQWSPSVREVIRRILMDSKEDNEIKIAATKVMAQKPSLENMGIFVEALGKTNSVDLLSEITSALRNRNPKGPSINEDLDSNQREAAIREWQKWWNDVRHKND